MDSKNDRVAATSVELSDYPSDVTAKGGTANDAADMARMGKAQALRRNFRFASIVGFVTIMQGTWESTLVANWFGLYDGGTAGIITMMIIVWLCMIATVACMAEMASMAPTAGGIRSTATYFLTQSTDTVSRWASITGEFSPESVQKPLSFLVGWSAFLAWVSGIPACAQLMVSLVQGMALLKYPDANVTALWQATLLIFLFLVLTFSFNVFLAKWLPLIENIMLVLHIIGFIAFLAILWALVDHAPAERVFTEFYDGGGWGSRGLATLVGIGSPSWCFVGADAGAHMSEELQDAGLQLPRGMMWATFFNGVMGVPMIISFCFAISSIDQVMDSATGVPILDIVLSATGSYAGTCILGTLLLLLYFVGSANVVAAATRQCWAFARDGGFPYSPWITKVDHQQPLNAVYVCAAVSFVLSAINFGSDVALNAILSVSNAALVFSYIVSIGCIMLKRMRGEALLPRRWSLGWMGLPLNALSMSFLLLSFVLSFFPQAPSVGDPSWAADFNWAMLIFAAFTLLAFGYYVFGGGRENYVPPVRLVKQE